MRLARGLVLLAALACLARASSLPIELRDEGAVANVILAAQKTVFVIAPQLRSRTMTDALRRAAVERGVRVLILCDAALTLERGGYAAALSLLYKRYPLEVRVLRRVSNQTAVVDQNRSVTGPLIANVWTFGLRPTRLDLEPSFARERARRFWTQWQRAKPWVYQVKNPSFSSVGGTK